MDGLSIAAGVVGIAVPALHCVRLLVDDLKDIVNAPDAIKLLKDNLLSIDNSLTSLQIISGPEWESLGESIADQTKSAMELCSNSCDRFRTVLVRWTRHSSDGKLSWQDRAMVGFFKQGQIKSMSKQLQNCKITLTSVVSIATLHSSLNQTHTAEDMTQMISTKETEVANAIEVTHKQLAEVNAKLGALQLARQDEGETEADRASAISQAAVEQTALDASGKLLQELLEKTKTTAANAMRNQGETRNIFGNLGKGFMIGNNSGAINSNFS
ncbi:hypothetical protein C8A03DRAFT_45950 [Achaetomium macrosporum]|uniref:Azaphilone pigments biosynthesis cluster protein L N-terminal domain-containing protein n=1 Tax=Achaetomium macrosporum TaxID=79813 RepID=A0AAN7H957_9PEZI|nr:hypothetical protein C8A03DRAFT_45950 [Achaetomium macrosporum]